MSHNVPHGGAEVGSGTLVGREGDCKLKNENFKLQNGEGRRSAECIVHSAEWGTGKMLNAD